MKSWLIAFAVAGLLVGCASTPEPEQKGAQVEDRKPVTEAPPVKQATKPTPPPVATTRPVDDGGVGANPLKDPNNILSKRSVYFDYDQNTVKEEFRPLVTAHGKYLSQNRSAHVTVQGNTDERGSREYNLALGQRRADAVKQMMTLSGAQSTQIETVSFGEEKPRSQGNDERAYAENRRADIVYRGE